MKLWRLSSLENFITLADHSDEVFCVAIAPDGNTLCSGSQDKSIRTYRVLSV